MRIATACGLVLLFPVLTIAEPRITIRVADLAKVPRDTIRKAQRYTAGIFSKAGVGIDWVDCSFEGNERVLASRCQRDLGLSEYWLLLELRKPPRSTGDMLAYADEGDGARQVGIYIPAVRETAATYHAEFFQIMGAAIAHEFGHVLLGANAHFPLGSMQPHWVRPQVELIAIGELCFTSAQAAQLRSVLKSLPSPGGEPDRNQWPMLHDIARRSLASAPICTRVA